MNFDSETDEHICDDDDDICSYCNDAQLDYLRQLEDLQEFMDQLEDLQEFMDQGEVLLPDPDDITTCPTPR